MLSPLFSSFRYAAAAVFDYALRRHYFRAGFFSPFRLMLLLFFLLFFFFAVIFRRCCHIFALLFFAFSSADALLMSPRRSGRCSHAMALFFFDASLRHYHVAIYYADVYARLRCRYARRAALRREAAQQRGAPRALSFIVDARYAFVATPRAARIRYAFSLTLRRADFLPLT